MSAADRLGVAAWLALEAPGIRRALGLRPAELQALARRRLAETLAAARRAPLHRRRLDRLLGETPLDEADAESVLTRLPLLTKRALQAAGTEAVAGGRPDASWRSSRSTGSTGEPLRVVYDRRAWAILKHLVKLRARVACGLRLRDRVALLDAFLPPETHAESPADGLPTWARRVVRLSALDRPERLAARLGAFRPDAIYGLPSALLDVAEELPRGPARPTPRFVFTSGELLGAGLRQAIGDAFGCPVFDVYGTSETKEVAWECPSGRFHLNADVAWLEVLDDEGRPVPAGREGALVVTSLVNRAMPLLRYVTGDRGLRLDEPCVCGLALPLLGVVAGREVEHVTLASGRRVSPYAFTCALEPVDGLLRYQIVQLAPERFVVRAQLQDGAAPDLRSRLQTVLRRALGEPVQIDIEAVEELPRGPGIKFRVVVPLPAGSDVRLRPGSPGEPRSA
jgi:phenylacetate-CoA ligase